MRAQGEPVYGETCPHYLLLTESMYARPDGYNFVMSPPLRGAGDNEALWAGLAGGWLSTVSSDDNSIDVEDKRAGAESFDRASPGCVDVETRVPLVFSEGVRRRGLPITRMVEVTAANPARIFGLYPQKGVIAAGSDADIVLIDPQARLRASPQSLHMPVHYSPYDGWDIVGLPVTTISKGQVIVEKGAFVGRPGHGHFLKRAINPAVLAYLDELRGAAEPDYAHDDAPVHAADQLLFKEGGQSQGERGIALHALQLRPDSQDAARA